MKAIRTQKIATFAAHDSNANCLKIGTKSGRVVVTGGQDKKVNLWAVGKSNHILSLPGHTSSVDCVSLDWPEELVIAGSASGCIKLWDLEQAKAIRTLTGHKLGVKSLEFHPFGEFFASSSSDKSVKLWDLRRKGCIQTYQGHNDCVNCIKITPDGRWVASGSQDGTVKLWDMTAGKLISTLELSSAIFGLSFNPSEFVIACSSETNVQMFDLQSFEKVSCFKFTKSGGISMFSPDGHDVIALQSGHMDVFSWDPIQPIYSERTSWETMFDAHFLKENGVIAGAINGNFVDIWGIQFNTKFETATAASEMASASPSVNYSTPEPTPKVDDFAHAKLNTIVPKSFPKLTTDISDTVKNLSIDRPPSKSIGFHYIPAADGNGLLGLDLATFMKEKPKTLGAMNLGILPSSAPPSESEIIDGILCRTSSMHNILQERLSDLQIVRDPWSKQDLKQALIQLRDLRNTGASVDLLKLISQRPNIITLELSCILLPIVGELLFEIYEDYLTAACKIVLIICKSFGGMIVSAVRSYNETKTVDISKESRLERCQQCFNEMQNIKEILKELSVPGKLGKLICETVTELSSLEN